MRGFDFNQAVVTTVIGGGIVLVPLLIAMLAVGFTDRDAGKVWGALAVIWAPAFFIWGGLPRSDENSN